MKRIITIIGMFVVLLFLGTPARADSFCAAGSICTIALSETNTVELEGIVVTLTIDNRGDNTVLSFQLTTNPLSNTPLGIDKVGWNTGSVMTKPDDWSAFGVGQMDGFGDFQFQSNNGAGTEGISAPLTFTLNGVQQTFVDNINLNEFAVHVRFGSSGPSTSCSGFVGGLVGVNTMGNSPGCSPVPESATLSLLGTGLIAIAGLVRRRLTKK